MACILQMFLQFCYGRKIITTSDNPKLFQKNYEIIATIPLPAGCIKVT